MKVLSVFVPLLTSIFFINCQLARASHPESAEISLQVEGASSTWVYLQGVHKNVKSKVDSTWLDTEGKGFFKYDTPLDQGYYELILSEDVSLPLLLDQDQTFSLKTNMEQLVRNMEVEGSTENALLYSSLQLDFDLQDRFQAEVLEIQQRGEQQLAQHLVDQLREKYFAEKAAFLENIFRQYPDALFTRYEKARQDPPNLYAILADQDLDPAAKNARVLTAFWDQVDFEDERLLHTPVIFDKLWQYFNQFVPDQTDIKIQAADVLMKKVMDQPAYYEFFATWLTDDYLPPITGQMDPDALYVHMVDNYLTEEYAPWADSLKIYAWQLRAKDRSVNLIGKKGADFSAKTPEGTIQSLDDVKAPYVALFFYHYDCDHCIETAPKLAKQYPALKEQGLEIIAVAMDTPEEEWKNFIRDHGMNCLNVTDQDNQAIYDHYNVWATPEIMLLNPDRTIIGKHLSVEDISMVMEADRAGMFQKENGSSASKRGVQ